MKFRFINEAYAPTEKEMVYDALIGPLYKEIKSLYHQKTGLVCLLLKWYYREDLESALFSIGLPYRGSLYYLVTYDRPSKVKPTNPSVISVDASSKEIAEYVDKMIENAKDFINRYYRDESLEEILSELRVSNKEVAHDFIQSFHETK